MEPLSKPKKILIVTVVIAAIVGVAIAAFRYMNPGVYMPYKCNEGGDSTRKFYGDNFRARGAVCDGFWIPFGSMLNGKKFSDVLASMSYFPKPTSKEAMRALAEQVAK